MFTGIIDHCGLITRIDPMQNTLRLWIKHSFTGSLELGESIAVNGVCLTVTHFKDHHFCCDISLETLKVTNIKNLHIDELVNLERALQPSSRIGGHFVMGHVDQTAHVKVIQPMNDFIEITFSGIDQEARKYLLKKGSISINGVSLTLNEITPDGFTVMLIPHTLEHTNLKKLQINDQVNIEFDMLARMIAKQIENLTQ